MEEVIGMSETEISKHYVIQSVMAGHMSQGDAGKALSLSVRQIRRLCARVKSQGARGVVHGLRGRPSNNQVDPGMLEKALCALHQPLWERFGPTFASEKLEKYHSIRLSKETVRRLMVQTDLWLLTGRRGWKHRQWRERRPCLGLLVQLDGSDHDWFEGRGPKCVLLIYIDDATSRILYGEFVGAEATLTLMRSTWSYLKRWGRPAAFYVDKDSIYKVAKAAGYQSLSIELPMTQFTRAMRDLGIDVITADSPQAKGRVERGFNTHQDRLVKELRLRGISTMADANRYLWNEYIPEHNARYAVEAASPADGHQPLRASHRLEEILSLRTSRVVMNDYTVRNENNFFQILKQQPVRVRPGEKVEVEQRLDGSTHLRLKGVYLDFEALGKRPYRPTLLTRPSEARHYGPHPVSSIGWKPPKEHPWRHFLLRRALNQRMRGAVLTPA